jgi:addiction module HigA family antidote
MKSLRSKERKPTHPGAILREDILPGLGLTQEQLAQSLGVSRRTVSELLHEKRPVTPDMAIRLSRLFGTTPDSWLSMQLSLDIWNLETRKKGEYSAIKKLNKKQIA